MKFRFILEFDDVRQYDRLRKRLEYNKESFSASSCSAGGCFCGYIMLESLDAVTPVYGELSRRFESGGREPKEVAQDMHLHIAGNARLSRISAVSWSEVGQPAMLQSRVRAEKAANGGEVLSGDIQKTIRELAKKETLKLIRCGLTPDFEDTFNELMSLGYQVFAETKDVSGIEVRFKTYFESALKRNFAEYRQRLAGRREIPFHSLSPE